MCHLEHVTVSSCTFNDQSLGNSTNVPSPATNTVVEAEFSWMRVQGVSFHSSRIDIKNPDLNSDEAMTAFLEDLRVTMEETVKRILHCLPTAIVMGMSLETFVGGKAGAQEFETLMGKWSGGLRVSTGAQAAQAAMSKFNAKKIGIITPYQAVGDEQVLDFFTQSGYEVHNLRGLRCDSATSIAEVHPDIIKEAFREVDGPEVDALLQVGTNLPAILAAAEMEKELGKPVVAINAATVWHAYRNSGINDRFEGFGRLFEEH